MIFEKQIVNTYKKMIYSRCDDVETVFYFCASDFPGLKAEPHSFTASAGHTLCGYFYEYEGADPDRLVVFDHGFGGGHLAYMKEIERLCRHGFKVFAYDHTGCMRSGGETPNGLAQSLCDLNDCITMLKSDPRAKDRDVSVVGHSWGAFSTMNITALHPEISHIVAISGFVSVEEMIKTFFSGMLKGYRSAVFALECSTNPRFARFNAVETLKSSDTKALLIYSENDKLCRRNHYDMLKVGLCGKENVKFILESNKGHNPNYTENAVKRLGEFSKAHSGFLKDKNTSKAQKEAFVASFDWDKITEQDDRVWAEIFDHLDI